MKQLAELLGGVPVDVLAGSLAVPVAAVVVDSRQVETGAAFVCLPGYQSVGGERRADGHEFIGEAVSRGAAVLVVDRSVTPPPGVAVVRVEDTWAAAAAMASAFHDHPSRALTVIGVTGTSGKTSTSYFVESVLRAAGVRTACFGTVAYRFGDTVLPASQTTPEAPVLQALLRRAVDQEFGAVVMEVSSHALELRRVDGVAFDVGVFTNLSHDHLNFHPDMEHYVRAKARLFEGLGCDGKIGTAVVNVDDPWSADILKVSRGERLTYGVSPAAAVRAVDVTVDLAGTRFQAITPSGTVPVAVPHLGDFNVHNALAALATGLALRLDPAVVCRGLATTPLVPGRFELVDCGQDFRVAVDYAHKPDALERLLRSARQLGPRRIITVFGCGGDRDRAKRPIMGRLAVVHSDVVVVTSDNPRRESPERIIEEILAGVRLVGGGKRILVEPDRARAIEQAIDLAHTGDIVVIAGKGHETVQLFADHCVRFDDRTAARVALGRRLGAAAVGPASLSSTAGRTEG